MIYNRTSISLDSLDSDMTETYMDSIFDNDFMFDPKMSFIIGKFISGYLQSKGVEDQIHKKYFQIMKMPFDSMANNKGLHYDDMKAGKGYQVCYDKYKESFNTEEILEKI